MKVKTFILSLFLTMFCSTSFGQHWGEIPNHYEGNMTFVTQIFIDDVLQGEDIEIGAFCGNEFRGSARPIASQSNMVYLLIEGDGDHNGDQISFRLARHYANAPSEELDYVIFNALTYEHNARIGASPADLVNGLLPEDDRDRTEFNSVASLNGEVYPSLANALAACTTGNNTIELLKDNAEDVTIKQVEGVNVTIDGGTSRYDYSGTITIHGNARYQGTETLTFKNIDFTTDKAGHYFIDSNSTGSVERYAHNVTVINCNFTATGAGENSAAAMRIRQGYNIAINGGKFNGLHSVLQAYGNAGINITGIESNCKNGISVGSSTNVVITGSDITATGATGYGVRAGENVTGPITITGTEINAFIPVSVRKVTDDTNCEFTFTGNTMTASNTDGYWCVIGTSEYEANGSLPETAGKIIVNATEQDLAGVYGYSRVEVTFADSTTKYFYKMEDAVPYNNADNYEGATIKLLSNCAGRGLRFWENGMTFDLNGKKYTINQAVGSSGTESQGFQIRPEVTGNVTIKNGTIDIKAGTNVKWMFNSYAADFVVQNVTIDGTNMVTNTSEDYLLVVQNAGDKATFENVTIQNYDAKKVYLEGNTTFVTPQEFDNSIVIPDGYVLEYENGAYIVKAGNVWNETKDKKYATLAEAITAAAAGDSLVLLADITENVTVNKDLTINGDNKQYTGNISVETSSTDITVKNVNFVNGTGYAITTNRIKSVTVEDCTVTDYGFGFLYANKSTPTVVVKNVTVDGGNYGFHWVYGTTATLENVTMTNVTYGLYIQNYAGKTINVKNSTISSIAIWERTGYSGVQTFKFEGANTVGTLTDSQYAKYVLTTTGTTLTAPEGFNVTTSVAEYVVVYENGAYIVKAGNVLNETKDKKYATLAEAIAAATAGDTLVLLADITENVTVNKDLTINGDNKQYTGNISVETSSTDITVKNVNFVNGTGYAITTNRIKSVTVEDCTVTDYGFGFLYANKSTPTVVVKNVTVDGGNYGFHWVYGTTATLENVTMTNVTYGLYIQNYAGKTINVKNSTISSIAIWERSGYSGVQTFKFEGANTVDTLTDSQYAKYVLAAADATLTAPEGYNVTSGVDNLEVIYKNGCYSLYGLSGLGTEAEPFLIYNLEDLKFFRDHVNAGKTRYNADSVYVALGANIDMASEDWSVNIGDDCNYTFDGIFDGNGFTISNLNSTETAQKADGYVCTGLFGAIYGNAVIKNLTIENVNINTAEYTGNNAAAVVGFVYDVNGKTTTIENVTVKGDVNINASGVYGVGAIVGYSYEGGAVNIMNCKVVANEGSVITAISGTGAIIGYCAGRTTIDGCTVDNIDITGKGLVGGIAGITSISNTKNLTNNTVKNVNLTATKAEWVNSTAIAVGTMSGDGLTVANTIFENVNASRMVGSVYAEQPTYVVPAVEARIENKYYGTFDAALAAAQEGNTITVLAPVVITEDKTYDLTGLSVDGENVYPIFRIQNGANVVVANGNISNDDYVFVLGASDGSSAGNLTIESGVYTGTTTVASVTKGLLTINGGEFKVNASEYGATYMINCIDANYNDDSANVEIYGGKFYGFNPEDNVAEGANTNFCAPGYAANEIETGVYEVVAGMVLNQTKGIKYATLSAAIAAATAGDTLVLLQNITENVTVNKDLTINGDNKQYTGNISVETSSTDITVKNVNFVNGTGYAITTNRIKSVTVEDCTVTDYGFGFLYANKSTPTVVVKNVTVDGGNYGFHWVYGTTATLENVTMTNVTYGLYIQNYAGKTINVKNSTISSIAIWERSGSSGVQTFNFEGANTVGTLTDSQYAKYVLAATDATLTAPEGANVTSGVQDYGVEYANGKYFLSELNYVAQIGDVKYISLQAAIDAAVDNDVIVVIDTIEVTIDDLAGLQLVGSNYPSYYVVRGKTISIDLNGMMIKANVTATDMLLGLFSTEQSGNLTLKDSSNGNGKVEIEATNDADVYSLITNYDSSSAITIDGGNYILNKVGDSGQSLIYDSPGKMVVNGGNFYLGNLGQGVGNVNENGIPWIFNVKGQYDGHVTVNGGTFNADVNHQHWAYEVNVPNTLALKYNGDEARTWTVVPAVAQGTDSWKGYNRSLGYASIADAAHWATAETTVTVVADHAITETAIVESNITLDFAGEEVTCSVNPAIRIQGNVNVTVKNGNMNTEGYNFILGASDGSSAGNLTIESGIFHGTTTVASVTKGNLNITGGEFSVEPYQGNYAFLINCIDANYNNGSATVSISGGTFHNWNPENNAAEGANTNFCAQGYGAVENPTDVWTVVPKQTAEVKDGWNWFSYYVEGDVLDQLQNSLGTVGVQIKSRTQFTQYSNDGSWNGDLVSTTPAESYKINVDADAVINVTGNIVDPSTCYIMLNNGGNNVGAWNWIGYPLAQETSVETAFAGVVKNGDEVKTRTGFAEYVNGQWWGSLMTLKPGVGYMYFRAGGNETVSDFTYPTPSSKEAVQPNITADANLWVPNSTSYANNMTMVAVLNMNGEMMNDNYEVAAMVNGEVRGSARPIYVEPMDAYMLFLTIHGEGVEEVTFQCYDFNTDTEYVLNNTINYSDDARLGSVNEPYVLCYGTMGIGENAMNTINIYPNPTTTGREINLGATCDKVEVYNALGVKVAEYQDVDTLDAIETAGIYVIRVTNDGDVKHCRLVVK